MLANPINFSTTATNIPFLCLDHIHQLPMWNPVYIANVETKRTRTKGDEYYIVTYVSTDARWKLTQIYFKYPGQSKKNIPRSAKNLVTNLDVKDVFGLVGQTLRLKLRTETSGGRKYARVHQHLKGTGEFATDFQGGNVNEQS